MKCYTERLVDSRTKIVLSESIIWYHYIMYREIPYRNWLGRRKYHWRVVAEVIAERVIKDINDNKKNFNNDSCGDLLLARLRKKAINNMKDRRIAVKERNLLNPKLW